MALEVFANNPTTTVTSGGTDAPSAGTVETWVVASSASFPPASSTASPPTQFHVADPVVPSDLSAVTNVSGTTWTVTRGAEGTTPQSHATGFTVEQIITAGALTSFLTANSGYATTASPNFTGAPTAPTQTAGDNSTKIATDAFVTTAVAAEASRAGTAEGLKANLASPALTGNPTAPTQTAGDNSTKLATTAYVATAVSGAGGGTATGLASATTTVAVSTATAPATGQVLTATSSTAATWQNSASGFSNPMTTAGDVIKGGTSGAAQRLAIGSTGQVLTVVSGLPAWAPAPSSALLQPTGTHSGDAALISSDLTTVIANTYGGTVDCAAGTWHLNPGDIAAITRSGIYFRWQPGSAIICTGSGDVVRMYDDTAYGGGRAINGGGILGSPTFFTQAMTGAWSAFHAGDILGLQAFLNVYNVGGTANDNGIHFDNNYYWSEQAEGDIRVTSCGVNYDNSANISGQATGSFYRGLINQFSISNGNCDCISLSNGALLNYGHYTLRGNVSTSSTQYWCIKLNGSSAATTDAIWEVGVELDDNAATAPGSIYFASGGNAFEGSGLLNWAGYPVTPSNNTGQFNFKGKVVGDGALPQLLSAGEYAQSIGNGSTFFSGVATFIVATATAATNGLIMAAGFERGQSCIIANASSYSLTFAASGTSNVAQGTGAVIAANTSREFRWSAAKSLWY